MNYPYLISGTCAAHLDGKNIILNVHSDRYDFSVVTNNLSMYDVHACGPHALQKVAVLVEGLIEIPLNQSLRPKKILQGRAFLLPPDSKLTENPIVLEKKQKLLGALEWFLYFEEKELIDASIIYKLLRNVSNDLPTELREIAEEWKNSDGRNDRSHDESFIQKLWDQLGI